MDFSFLKLTFSSHRRNWLKARGSENFLKSCMILTLAALQYLLSWVLSWRLPLWFGHFTNSSLVKTLTFNCNMYELILNWIDVMFNPQLKTIEDNSKPSRYWEAPSYSLNVSELDPFGPLPIWTMAELIRLQICKSQTDNVTTILLHWKNIKILYSDQLS